MSSPSDSTPRQLRDRLLPPAGPHFVLDERQPILVEFHPVDSATAPSETAQAQASARSLNSALNSMRQMAKLVSEAMTGLPNEPSQVDVRFGLRLDASGKAFVVESGDTASLAVTLTWMPPAAPSSQAPDAASGAVWGRDVRRADSDRGWKPYEAARTEDDWDEAAWEDDGEETYYPAYGSHGYDPRGYDPEFDDPEFDDPEFDDLEEDLADYGRGSYAEDDYGYPEEPEYPDERFDVRRSPWNRQNRPRGYDPRPRRPY